MPSSIEAKPFKAEDWGKVSPVEGISVFNPSPEVLAYVEHHAMAITLWNDGGTPVAYFGVRPLAVRRLEVWAIIDCRRSLREFIEIHNIAKERLNGFDADRIEAFVECEFKAGHAWLLRLGFTMEAPRMRRYLPDGKDCALYARVRGGDGQWECLL